MTYFQKAFLLIVGYALFYFISIRSCKENDNEYSETAIVVDFIEEKTFNGRTHGRFFYPEVLVVYNSDIQYFAKREWNRFLNLTIGDEVNAKFSFEDIYSKSSDTTISSIKNLLTKEQIDSIENKIGCIEGFETIGNGTKVG